MQYTYHSYVHPRKGAHVNLDCGSCFWRSSGSLTAGRLDGCWTMSHDARFAVQVW